MRIRLIRALFNLSRIYSRWIGPKEAVFFATSEYTGHKDVRPIKIASKCIYVRTSTPDLNIALSWLIEGEYDDVESSNVSVIVDAGAHIGISSIYFACKYPRAQIFAIEPESDNYNLLLINTYKYKNIIPLKAAIWGQQTARSILDRLTGTWGYTISETDNRTIPTGQKVDCITVKSLLEKYNLETIDILKMDIEGSEQNVLENSEAWIDKVKIISAELHDRICTGCERAFYNATKEFARFEKNGEKVTAYRE